MEHKIIFKVDTEDIYSSVSKDIERAREKLWDLDLPKSVKYKADEIMFELVTKAPKNLMNIINKTAEIKTEKQ